MSLLRAGDLETLAMGRPHGNGRATIMGIGKALPEHVFEQKSFPDYYFDITDSKHLVDLKARFAKICKSTIFIMYLIYVCLLPLACTQYFSVFLFVVKSLESSN